MCFDTKKVLKKNVDENFFRLQCIDNFNSVIVFMQSDEIPLLTPMFKPLVRKLGSDKWLSPDAHSKKQLRKQQDVLQGQRGVRYPLIALTTQRSMGPMRHVLSQKVVGGTMVIHPPFERSNPSTQFSINNSRSKFWRKL